MSQKWSPSMLFSDLFKCYYPISMEVIEWSPFMKIRIPVRWTGYLTRRRASALPLLHARFCAPSVTRWSLLPARYGTGFSSEPGGDVPGCCYRFLTPWKHYANAAIPGLSPCVVFLKLIEYIDRYYHIDRYKRSFVVNDLLRGCHENAS